MLFTHTRSHEQVPLLVEPGSLVVMPEEACYTWKHSIPARKADVSQGQRLERGRRISLTFRIVIVG